MFCIVDVTVLDVEPPVAGWMPWSLVTVRRAFVHCAESEPLSFGSVRTSLHGVAACFTREIRKVHVCPYSLIIVTWASA